MDTWHFLRGRGTRKFPPLSRSSDCGFCETTYLITSSLGSGRAVSRSAKLQERPWLEMPFLPIRNTKLSDNSKWQSTCQTGAVIQQGFRKGQILKGREPMRALLGDLVHSKTRGSNPTLLPPLGGSPLRYSIVSRHLACRWRGLGACDGPVPRGFAIWH